MDIVSALAVYFIIWWTVLFAVLPFGVERSAKHSDTGAPETPNLKRKAVITTLVSFVIWLVFYIVVSQGIFSFREAFGS